MTLTYKLITTNHELETICENAASHTYIALDTEFVRMRTYYPQLGLIQLYFGEETVALIDPLAITEWQPFLSLMTNTQVTKIFHACSEDLEVFNYKFNLLPQPIIDTQIIASFIGHPISSGFATLVEEYLGVKLDKSEARTDWLHRPLNEKQYHYAAADVFYLLPLANKLLAKIKDTPWLAASHEEMSLLIKKKNRLVDSLDAYKTLPSAHQLTHQHLACLQLLAKWRLEYAKEHDMALNFVVRGEALFTVAKYLPHSLPQLNELGMKSNEIRIHGKTLLNLVKQAQFIPEADYPPPIQRIIDLPNYKKNSKKLKSCAIELATTLGLKPELLAPNKYIDHVLIWLTSPKPEHLPELLDGWRKPYFAPKLITLTTDKHINYSLSEINAMLPPA